VVSRSYLVAGGRRHSSADFCDTTHCQFLRQPPAPTSPAARATAATQGLVLAWHEQPFAAMFSASCGGRTHSLAEIGYAERDYPYFAVECPACRRRPERWSSALPPGDATAPNDERLRIRAGRKLGWGAVPSPNFSAQTTDDGTELSGVGRGHGIGLCQRGARGLALDGRDFRAILTHYFPNTTVHSPALR
jgi:stage II sporulation protein D